jgi:hypothetical protein
MQASVIEVETVTVSVDVTMSSPASFITLADSKKPTGTKKNIKSCAVAGKVTDSEGEEHEFKFANCSYDVAGTSCPTTHRTSSTSAATLPGGLKNKQELTRPFYRLWKAHRMAAGRLSRRLSARSLSRGAR